MKFETTDVVDNPDHTCVACKRWCGHCSEEHCWTLRPANDTDRKLLLEVFGVEGPVDVCCTCAEHSQAPVHTYEQWYDSMKCSRENRPEGEPLMFPTPRGHSVVR